jgi:hypothetical protein
VLQKNNNKKATSGHSVASYKTLGGGVVIRFALSGVPEQIHGTYLADMGPVFGLRSEQK